MPKEKRLEDEECTLVKALVVLEAFGTFRKGDAIRDPEQITAILASPQRQCVRPLQEETR